MIVIIVFQGFVEQSTFQSVGSALEYLRESGHIHDGVSAILEYDGGGQTSTYDGIQLGRMIDAHVLEFETSMREQSHLESEIPN